MALPKIDLPIMELSLPSSGEKIKFRPFTVKEEKILLIAQESDDPSQEIIAAKQIVSNCLVEKDVSELAMFDLEYVLLILRSRSVNNTIDFQIKDSDTGEDVSLTLNLDEVTLQRYDNHSNEVKINDEFRLFLKYPTIDEFIKLTLMDMKDPLSDYLMLCSCIDYIASEDEIHRFSDYTQADIDAFMDTLSGEVIKGITNFFETMPRLRHEMKYKNSEGKDKTFVIEGMRSFFI